jgi:ketosteroid isomerase-like protein
MGNRQVVERYARALAEDDFDTQDALIHDDYEARWPQSGEVIRGRVNRRAILENYPGASSGLGPTTTRIVGRDDEFVTGPSWNIIHLAGSGDELTVTGTIDYPDLGTWHFASLVTVREGKIWRQVDYYAPPFDPPAWRAPYVDVERA